MQLWGGGIKVVPTRARTERGGAGTGAGVSACTVSGVSHDSFLISRKQANACEPGASAPSRKSAAIKNKSLGGQNSPATAGLVF